jgi:hypothetical protein
MPSRQRPRTQESVAAKARAESESDSDEDGDDEEGGGGVATATAEKPKAVKTPKPVKNCECGCGGTTKSHFVTGHDAKHKSALIERAVKGEEDAEAELRNRGWIKFLVQKREILNQKQVQADKREQVKIEGAEQKRKDEIERKQRKAEAAKTKTESASPELTMDDLQSAEDVGPGDRVYFIGKKSGRVISATVSEETEPEDAGEETQFLLLYTDGNGDAKSRTAVQNELYVQRQS